MTVTVGSPGVYIEELKSQTLSITSGATAVPVFACRDDEWPTLGSPPKTKPIRINNWLEFSKLYDPDEFFSTPTRIEVALKAYFDNGGGYCYIARLGEGSPALTKTHALDDITLIVFAGVGIDDDLHTLLSGTGRFALKDTDEHYEINSGVNDLSSERNINLAVYYPWLKASWAGDELIPPSAAMAGVICSVDRKVGPWQAPANVALLGGLTPVHKVTDDEQALYMGEGDSKALNMIREFTGSGVRVWGARTAAGSTDKDEWVYIPVRRLFSAVEKDLKSTLMFSVFEPNSQPTWERVRGAIDSYLNDIWQSGGLMGTSQAEAYFIQVGLGTTMTQDDINQGKMIIKIGMAAVRPAEFIILEFTQDMQLT